MLKLSGMGRSRIIPPIAVPADGTQTKSPDLATPRHKERPFPSHGNPPSTATQGPRAPLGLAQVRNATGPCSCPVWGVWGREDEQPSTENLVTNPPLGSRSPEVGGAGRRGEAALGLKRVTWWGGGVIPDRGTIRGQGAGWEEGGGGGWKKVAVEGNRKPCGQVWGLDNRDISDDFEAGVI